MPPSFMQRAKAAVGLLTGNLSPEARQMLASIMPGGRGEPPKRGTKEYLEAYNTAPWLRGAAGRVAQSFASVRWSLHAATGRSGKIVRATDCQRGDMASRTKALARRKDLGELKEITEHPMLDLLYRGNSLFTGIAIRRLLSIYLDVPGEEYWFKERNALGVPVAAWPLPPHWVAETPTPTAPRFRVSYMGWQANIPENDVLWFCDPNPVNPYSRGAGLAMTLGDELDTDEAAAKHARAFFFNRGRPDILIAGEGIGEAEMKHLETRWREKSRRYLQAVVPMFLNKGVTVQELGDSMKDMEFTRLREFERNTVMQTWGLPPEIMGVLESSNRATIDAADVIMGRYVLTPRLEFVREILQERLAPEYDDRLIVQYDSPVSDDKEMQLRAALAAPYIPQVDEWRKLMGLGPAPDDSGKRHIVPFGLTSVENLADLGESDPPPTSAGEDAAA